MSAKHFFDSVYLSWFSQPKCDRSLYRIVKKQRISKLVEIGLSDLSRSQRLIRLARQLANGEREVRYTGVDLFEARPADQPAMTLKSTHRSLAQSGATIRLIPGDPMSALSRYANHLGGTELLIVSHLLDQDLGAAWYYVPRMLADEATLLLQSAPDSANRTCFTRVLPDEIQRLAGGAGRSQRNAA